MNTFISESFSIISFCFITIACNTNNGYPKSEPLTMNDTLVFVCCQDKIKAKVGSIVEIQLEAVPVTGFEWLLKDSSLLLEQIKTDVLKYTKQGQHSFQILHFKAMKKGTETIQLEYRRVFEKGVEKSCDIKIEII
jgi:predicted secreted protein